MIGYQLGYLLEYFHLTIRFYGALKVTSTSWQTNFVQFQGLLRVSLQLQAFFSIYNVCNRQSKSVHYSAKLFRRVVLFYFLVDSSFSPYGFKDYLLEITKKNLHLEAVFEKPKTVSVYYTTVSIDINVLQRRF